MTLEDIGSGADVADATINALYEDDSKVKLYWAKNNVCLKDEFLIAPCAEYHEQVKNVVVLFGGSDPSDFTYRAYNLAKKMHADFPHISFRFVLGAGYDNHVHKLSDDEAARSRW